MHLSKFPHRDRISAAAAAAAAGGLHSLRKQPNKDTYLALDSPFRSRHVSGLSRGPVRGRKRTEGGLKGASSRARARPCLFHDWRCQKSSTMSIQSRAVELLTPAGSDVMTDSWRSRGAHPPDTPIVSANGERACSSSGGGRPLTMVTGGSGRT